MEVTLRLTMPIDTSTDERTCLVDVSIFQILSVSLKIKAYFQMSSYSYFKGQNCLQVLLLVFLKHRGTSVILYDMFSHLIAAILGVSSQPMTSSTKRLCCVLFSERGHHQYINMYSSDELYTGMFYEYESVPVEPHLCKPVKKADELDHVDAHQLTMFMY